MKYLFSLFLIVFLSSCATIQSNQPPLASGYIVGLNPFIVQETDPNFLGGAIGAGAGGLLGHQIGKGNGKTLATIAGVATGAVVGSQIGKKTVNISMVEIWVKDQTGSVHKIQQKVQQLDNYGGWKLNQYVFIRNINGKPQVTVN